jgi:mercuric ion transport protein
MRAVAGSVIAAVVASACCIGPVVLVLLGVGAFGASLAALEPYRPVFLTVTAAFLGVAFYTAYRPINDCDAVCTPASRRGARRTLWFATIIVLVLVTFPYYVRFLF